MALVTGRLYLSTNSSKARRSPRLTRSIRAASGSRSAAMGVHANKNPQCHKVAGDLNDESRMTNDESNSKPELPGARIAEKPNFRVSDFFRHSSFVIRHSYGAHACLQRWFEVLSCVNADVVGKDRGQRHRTFVTPA